MAPRILAGDDLLNQIVTGDARELARAIPDGSVDLVFTDPVYDRMEDYEWLGREAARVLKPNSAALVFFGIGHMGAALDALRAGGLSYRWQLVLYYNNRVRRLHVDAGWSNYTACFWMENGRMKARRGVDLLSLPVFDPVDNVDRRVNHGWSKPSRFYTFWLERFTAPGGLVWDPFTGGGTLPAACQRTGRRFIAFEQDAATAQRARRRLRPPQMPLCFEPAEWQPPLELP